MRWHIQEMKKMNRYPSPINVRSHLSDNFIALQAHAVRASLSGKLTGQNAKLEIFAAQAARKSPNRKLVGVNDIALEQVVGTLNRQGDFDKRFRPLKRHLRERWVNVHHALEGDGWLPVVVHQVGAAY
jgi:hypothetical protein